MNRGARIFAVAGLGISGRAVSEVLVDREQSVWALESHPDVVNTELAQLVESGLPVVAPPTSLEEARAWLRAKRITTVIASPGWAPSVALLSAAESLGLEVWSEAELAWFLRPPGAPQWLVVTGTNGKTTTVRMLAEMLREAGKQTAAVGNIGQPLIHAALDPSLDLLAVELSSFQLHYTHSIEPLASALLNIAPDHLDWHGSFEQYRADKAKVYERTVGMCLYNRADPDTEEILRNADVAPGVRALGVTLEIPAVGDLGVVAGRLYDRAVHASRRTAAQELASFADLQAGAHETDGQPPPAHLVEDALFAAGLALTAGALPQHVSAGLRNFTAHKPPHDHRGETVAVHNQISFLNNSKATNPHAAQAAFSGLKPGSVIWIAGGLTKGANLNDLVQYVRPWLKAAVLIGADASEFEALLARHAPDLPVIRIEASHTGGVRSGSDRSSRSQAVMAAAVGAAIDQAAPGDTVLLAPACASQDQFESFAQRGDAFVSAIEDAVEEGGKN